MKLGSSIILLMFYVFSLNAQIEKSKSVLNIDADDHLSTERYSLSSGLSKPQSDFRLNSQLMSIDSLRFNRTQKPFDMTGDNGLLKPGQKIIPKWFKKDKDIKEEYKSDQYLGDFKSNGTFVQLLYRDHESVDGDMVRIYVNGDIVRSSVFLGAVFNGIRINLIPGFNRIDIEALNQGSSGPNTAEFQLYDDLGNLITANEWNLTTGVKATLIVVKP